jgi:hypothetical protein
MRRVDMEQDRWYLIRFGCGEKAGRVIDAGRHPGKVLVVTRWDVYLAGSCEDHEGRLDRLNSITDDQLVEAALEFLETGKNRYREDGDPLRHLEAGWVNTNDILGDLYEASDAMVARRAADHAERLAKDAAKVAARQAVADRWMAVAELVDSHRPPRGTAERPESVVLASIHGPGGHGNLTDNYVTYGQLLAVYEAWAADRALLLQGCAA